MKLFTAAERAVIKKDFSEIWSMKMVRNTLIFVPACLVALLPAAYLIMIYTVPMEQMNGIEEMMQLLPESALQAFTIQQAMFYLMTNMICPLFFLMVPLMASTVSASCSFVGEKERGTIQTLLLTPMRVRELFKAKVAGCMGLSLITTAVSFGVFTMVVSVGNILLKMPFFLNWNWLILVFVLSPALTIFGVFFMVLVSGRSKSYLEAMQLSGYIVLPLILLFVGQFTGLFQLNVVVLLMIGAFLILADFILWFVAAKAFTPEKLLK